LGKLKELMAKLNYSFNNIAILEEALTHSSYAYEHSTGYNNERLELLGDSVLNLVITDYLFNAYPNLTEGDLSKLRSNIVSEKPLYKVATAINIGAYLLLSHGEVLSHGDERPSTLADTVEAIIGAVYIDGGFEEAKRFVLSLLASIIKEAEMSSFNDYKSELQERLQQDGYCEIKYEIVKEEGQDHNKLFFAEVQVNGEVIGKGAGRSKKDAEQDAAHHALNKLFSNGVGRK